MSTAEKIAEQFDNDGSRFCNGNGQTLDEVCRVSVTGGRAVEVSGDRTRYVFDDNSVITIAGGGWDFGYSDCWCWQSVGHEKCSAVEDQ